ncbi:TetR/AcrR family transcriptional regulator [Isoalcanivorax indicus]|uniref:TetR/AcrR family transcriptional regulator n=1 Tax=Isoalcanivorax indicus TaxID=2202653 RepID=UPI000DB920C2|nr:TetR/AcrR family transcriptional regulator [Isoalcanivorax indicus]
MTTVANTEPTQPTRERILNAALICFAERGYAATGMREIARQVGIRAPSLYNHFGGKREILVALLERMGPARITRALADLAPPMSPAVLHERLLTLLFALWRDVEENRLMRLFCGEALHDPAIGRMLEQQIFGQEKQHLASAIAGALGGARPSAAQQQLAQTYAALCIAIGFGKRFQLLLGDDDPARLEAICDETRVLFDAVAGLLPR